MHHLQSRRPPLLDSDCSSPCRKQDCKNKSCLCFNDIPRCYFSQWRKKPKVTFCDSPEAVLLEIGAASCSSCSHQEDGKENTLISMGDDLRSCAHVCEILALFSLAFRSAKTYRCIILGSNEKITFLECAFGRCFFFCEKVSWDFPTWGTVSWWQM